jgi:dipeptidase E
VRMYLSSFRMGDHPERLLALLGHAGSAAVIANAMDGQRDEDRSQGVQRELVALRDLGLGAEELDLRDYFDAPTQLATDLSRHQLLWLRGGNVFMLRYALAASRADAAIADLLERDAVVYAGYSAGPCLLGPSLRGLEICDDPSLVTETYGVPTIWDGLGVLPYAIVPHYRSPAHPETRLCGLVAERYEADGVPHRTLQDGQALVIDGPTTTIC